jgi:hypothetical protein
VLRTLAMVGREWLALHGAQDNSVCRPIKSDAVLHVGARHESIDVRGTFVRTLKRDYVWVRPLPDTATTLAQIAGSFEDLYELDTVKPSLYPQLVSSMDHRGIVCGLGNGGAFSTSTCIRSGSDPEPRSRSMGSRVHVGENGTKLQLSERVAIFKHGNRFTFPTTRRSLNPRLCGLEPCTVRYNALFEKPPKRDCKLSGESNYAKLA